jgi:hypothetical protein
MEEIKDKIAKLLALADSPNENEAKLALLKARALMAEHKLRPDELAKSVNVVRRKTGIICTKMTNSWAVMLANVVAAHYCCKSYISRVSRGKTAEIGFIGFEGDIDVCERIYKYAFDCVASHCREMSAKFKAEYGAAYTRELANAYGVGFCNGLKSAYAKQSAEHREWGLILTTPQEVTDEWEKLGRARPFAKPIAAEDSRKRGALTDGYKDGSEFDPSTKITQEAIF